MSDSETESKTVKTEENVDTLRLELERLKLQVEQQAKERKDNVVYIKREKTLKKFTGDDDTDIEEWITDCISALRENRQGSARDDVSFIIQHLEGSAKKEVRLHVSKHTTVDDIFQLLRDNFSGTGSFNEAIQKFYARRQRSNEGIREFSYELKELLQKVTSIKPNCFPHEEEVLRDHFINGIRDTVLRRELKRTITEKKSLSFIDARMIALKWSEDIPPSPSPVHAAQFFHPADSFKVAANSEIEELKSIAKQQQETIAKLVQAVTELKEQRKEPSVNLETPRQRIECYKGSRTISPWTISPRTISPRTISP